MEIIASTTAVPYGEPDISRAAALRQPAACRYAWPLCENPGRQARPQALRFGRGPRQRGVEHRGGGAVAEAVRSPNHGRHGFHHAAGQPAGALQILRICLPHRRQEHQLHFPRQEGRHLLRSAVRRADERMVRRRGLLYRPAWRRPSRECVEVFDLQRTDERRPGGRGRCGDVHRPELVVGLPNDQMDGPAARRRASPAMAGWR